ncbi:hypothetical protein CKO12_08635 [Chromatium okenii]|uniref:phosphatase PAP2 family protein n=1 Tax=Chromatium okenii TaxID=61644 RepID=UPI001904B743|nr:hypothetical protein [Chromatium okenii]
MKQPLLLLAFIGFFITASLFFVGGYHAGFYFINQWATAYPEWLWQWLTVLGDERVAFTLMLVLAWRYPQLLWPLLFAAILATLYSRGLKELFDATRPAAVLAADSFQRLGCELRQYSFPSGHSVTAGMVGGVLLLQLRWIEARIALILFVILIGISRIAVGAHWPIDVAAGLSGGFLAAELGARLAARWSAPTLTRRSRRVLLGLAAPMVLSLLVNDGGYPQAALLLQLIGGTAFFYLTLRF